MEQTVFGVEIGPTDELTGRLSELDPTNPFCTPVYAGIRSRLGAEVSTLVLRTNGRIVGGCLAFRTKGRLNSRLEITSFPQLPDFDIFWKGLFDHCRATRTTVLNINTFASPEIKFPEVPRPLAKKTRIEYVLDLTTDDLSSAMNRRSRRMVTRARTSGLYISEDSGPDARADHVALANRSLDRLRHRGEEISSTINRDEIDLYLESGFGELFQVKKDSEVFSTLVIVKGATGAYCQSSGTSEEGRDLGASHFIFHETACRLKEKNFHLLNIGGSSLENQGLNDFKAGLGGRAIELESADYFLGGPVKRLLSKGAELIGR